MFFRGSTHLRGYCLGSFEVINLVAEVFPMAELCRCCIFSFYILCLIYICVKGKERALKQTQRAGTGFRLLDILFLVFFPLCLSLSLPLHSLLRMLGRHHCLLQDDDAFLLPPCSLPIDVV